MLFKGSGVAIHFRKQCGRVLPFLFKNLLMVWGTDCGQCGEMLRDLIQRTRGHKQQVGNKNPLKTIKHLLGPADCIKSEGGDHHQCVLGTWTSCWLLNIWHTEDTRMREANDTIYVYIYILMCEEQHMHSKGVWNIKHGLVQHSLLRALLLDELWTSTCLATTVNSCIQSGIKIGY
jgi:hypothetical protein